MASVSRHLTTPLYSYAEADRLARATRGTARRWLEGYSYRKKDGARIPLPPVTPRRPESREAVSFLDLIDIFAIARLREIGFTVQRIRQIVVAARERFGVDHPFSSLEFKADGRQAFIHREGILHPLLGNRAQPAWDDLLGPFLETLDYRGDRAYRWWPLGRDKPIVIDPEYGFGLPVISGSGVRTETIRERVEVGDSYDQVAYDFGVSRDQVESAVRFELQRAA
ncbi:MAG: DUF433 domain-containing protein [Dehalococcoidia bacterium]|nr:DUF433 domain-containing protein [Dehalococcoidia bacterium]